MSKSKNIFSRALVAESESRGMIDCFMGFHWLDLL